MILMIREGVRLGSAGGRAAATRCPARRVSHTRKTGHEGPSRTAVAFLPAPPETPPPRRATPRRAAPRRRNTFQLIWSYFRIVYEKGIRIVTSDQEVARGVMAPLWMKCTGVPSSQGRLGVVCSPSHVTGTFVILT
ncbi:hypothetical protein E2C01_057380 [Portunus trituberculatus]|uniref:Uncharacterized protein n=1 Tax=Portunus trituberculatus TaxID=210409 RepID=A0A5B7H374_PORTR|nr:hypothetical protein [Portunus trituberculatus]